MEKSAFDKLHLAQLEEEVAERKRMEELLRKASAEWRATFDSTRELIMTLGADGTIRRVNQPTTEFFAADFEAILGRAAGEFFSEAGLPEELFIWNEAARQRRHREVEVFLPGRKMWLLASVDPIFDERREVLGLVYILRDISELKRAEEERNEMHSQLLQMQKMDSIGRLAGGVAHDFNNMLSAILAYGEFAHDQVPEDHPARNHLLIVLSAAEKAAALTRQLLAFSRKQVLEKRAMNLSSAVENMGRMLGRIIGAHVQLDIRSSGGGRNVLADPGQIEQIIMNLAVNARDAMPSGGRLVVETFDFAFEGGTPPPVKGMPPGEYSALAVSDTGTGIPTEIREKIFEPFFTTKDPGKGTGLGLSTVYGIVTQHDGHILLESDRDSGTRITLYLPSTDRKTEEESAREALSDSGGSETILVVDGDENIRRIFVDTLRPLGYLILSAGGFEEALDAASPPERTVDLVVAEVMVAGGGGRELVERFREHWPATKIMLMSGYSSDSLEEYLAGNPSVKFLEKPLTPGKLARSVREALGRGASGP